VVEEDELVSLARDESATHHRAVVEETAAEIRRVLAVVEAANYERAPNIPELEGHQDLVVYLGHEKRPAVGAGAKLGNPSPGGLVVVVEPWELQLDPRLVVGIVVIRDLGDDDPIDGCPAR